MSHRFVTSDGTAIAYRRWAESSRGPAVVLHHGFAASASANFDAVLAVNPQRIVNVIGDARCKTFPGDDFGVIRYPGFAEPAADFLKP